MASKLFQTLSGAFVVGLFGAMGAVACGSDGDPPSTSAGAGGGGGGGGASEPRYEDSACGGCVKTSCAAEIDACASDPGCAQYLACLYACPVGANGDADAACVSECAVPDSSTARAAQQAVAACRAFGRGATRCPQCGVSNHAHPLLNQECPASEETNACFKCEDEHGCGSYAACKSEPACDALAQCLKACPAETYDACEGQCLADHPDGVGLFGARIGVITVLCAETPDTHEPVCSDMPLSGCERCTNAECGDEFIACYADAECYLLSRCAASCGSDGGCFDACLAEHPSPEAQQRFNDFAVCSTESCSAECG